MSVPSPDTVDRRLASWYRRIADRDGAGSSRGIEQAAVPWVPRNFFAYLASSTLSKLGDELSNPKTVLAWVMSAVGAPTSMVALLVPIRESGSMLPQLALGGWVRRRRFRKPIWMLGSVLQAMSVLGCAGAAAWLDGIAAGALILTCVVAFSLARSLNSIAGKDVVGRTIPKGKRGRLGGWATGLAGLLTLGVGAWFAVIGKGEHDPIFFISLLVAAAVLWTVATLVFATIREVPGEVAGVADGWRDPWNRLALVRTDAPFRRFVTTRALLLCSALTAPFYVVLAREHGTGGASLLGSFLLAGGLASSLSAPAWGVMADRSSRRVMNVAALLASVLGLTVFALVRWRAELVANPWVFPVFFFCLGVAHAGVRVGRKTYIVDLAGGVKRTDYVSVSNTLIGLVLLLVGAVTSLVSFLDPEEVILGLSVFGLGGAGLSLTLPEVE